MNADGQGAEMFNGTHTFLPLFGQSFIKGLHLTIFILNRKIISAFVFRFFSFPLFFGLKKDGSFRCKKELFLKFLIIATTNHSFHKEKVL